MYLVTCIAAAITSNIDGSVCQGDELIYTCVGQGTSQRWCIKFNNGDVLVDHVFTRGDELGRVIMRHPYNFTLLSATQNLFESTVSVVATTSIHNFVVECTCILSRDSVTTRIAGH